MATVRKLRPNLAEQLEAAVSPQPEIFEFPKSKIVRQPKQPAVKTSHQQYLVQKAMLDANIAAGISVGESFSKVKENQTIIRNETAEIQAANLPGENINAIFSSVFYMIKLDA